MNSSSLPHCTPTQKKKLHTIAYGGHHNTGGSRENRGHPGPHGTQTGKEPAEWAGLGGCSTSRSCRATMSKEHTGRGLAQAKALILQSRITLLRRECDRAPLECQGVTSVIADPHICPEVAQPLPLDPGHALFLGKGTQGRGGGHLAWSPCGGHWSKASLPGDTDRGYPREHGIVGPAWEPIAQALSCTSIPKSQTYKQGHVALPTPGATNLSKITYLIVHRPGVGLCPLMAQT